MVKTEQYRSVGDAIADYNKGEMHLLIFDGAPAASKTKLQIAKSSQLILLPTGISLDDLEPKVRLAHEYFPCKEVQTIQSKAIEIHKQLEMSKSKGLELEL